MVHRAAGFAAWQVILIVVCIVAAGTGLVAVVWHHNRPPLPAPVAAVPETEPARALKVRPTPGGDSIGFHGGGPMLGVASEMDAPPMQVRWTFRCDDDDEPAPAAAPATAAPAAPVTVPATTLGGLSPGSPPPATGEGRPPAGTQPTSTTLAAGASTRPATLASTHPAPVNTYHRPGNFEGGAAIVGGWVYVGDTSGVMRALDVKTGQVQWRFHAEGGFLTTPLVLDGRVFIGDDSGMFYALSAKTGAKLWSYDATSEIRCSANFLAGGKQIVFATDNGDIFCFEAATGKSVWIQKGQQPIYGTPSVANGMLLVTGCDAQLRGLRTTDGAEQFAVDLGDQSGVSIPVAGDRLVLGTGDGKVLCFSAKTHKQLWLFDKIEPGTEMHSSAAVSDNIVVFGSQDRNVYALELATGKLIWTFETRGEVDSSPVISGGRVYIGSGDKNLYVLDLKTGSELASFTGRRGFVATPSIGNGVLVIGDTGGNLFCLE